ncbi:MAG: response regulator [Saprospiraceae bacterium]|nr:response regulator [Pyrinomonadaceae bacterium]
MNTKRILCVEDDEDSCEMLNVLLSLADDSYSVTGVHDAERAMELIAIESFDLYVVDIWLPKIDGLELSRWIRRTGSVKPIVFFTAIAKDSDRANAMNAGADAFLIKPNDLDRLVPTVERLLTESRMSAANTQQTTTA